MPFPGRSNELGSCIHTDERSEVETRTRGWPVSYSPNIYITGRLSTRVKRLRRSDDNLREKGNRVENESGCECNEQS